MEKQYYQFHLTEEVKRKMENMLVFHMAWKFFAPAVELSLFCFVGIGIMFHTGPMIWAFAAVWLILLSGFTVFKGIRQSHSIFSLRKVLAGEESRVNCSVNPDSIVFVNDTYLESGATIPYGEIVRLAFWNQDVYIVDEKVNQEQKKTSVHMIPKETFRDNAEYRALKRWLKKKIRKKGRQ